MIFAQGLLLPVLWHQQDVFLCTKTFPIALRSRVLAALEI